MPLVESCVLVIPSGDSIVPSSDAPTDSGSPTAEDNESFQDISDQFDAIMVPAMECLDRLSATLEARRGKTVAVRVIELILVRIEARLQRKGFCGDIKKRSQQMLTSAGKASPRRFLAALDARAADMRRSDACLSADLSSLCKDAVKLVDEAQNCVNIVDRAWRRQEKTERTLRRVIREDRRRNRARGPRPLLTRSPKPRVLKKM
jgi:hypothetical protein